MAVSEFLEDLVSHIPALQLLQQVGYQYLTPTEALDLRGSKRSGLCWKRSSSSNSAG